jgi:hypothetical protein
VVRVTDDPTLRNDNADSRLAEDACQEEPGDAAAAACERE